MVFRIFAASFLLLLMHSAIHASDSVAISIFDADHRLVLDRDNDTIYMRDYEGTPKSYQLWVNIENDWALGGMILCFRIWSPDGAQWHYEAQPGGIGKLGPNTGIAAITAIRGSRLDPPDEAFDMTGLLVTEKNVDGIVFDSIALGGVSLLDSLVQGTMEPMIAIHFAANDIAPSDIKTLCFDSAFIPPDPAWGFTRRNGTSFPPKIGPAVCFPVRYQKMHLENVVTLSIYDVFDGRVLNPETDTIVTIDSEGNVHPYQLWISIENSLALTEMSLGFRIWSPDGAQWLYNTQPDGIGPGGPNTGLSAVTVGPGTRLDPPEEAFDMTGLLVTEKNVDGLLEDTLAFGGISMMDSLLTGPMENMIIIHFTPGGVPDGEVKTMCFDSAWVPPVGWSFSHTSGAPFPPLIGPPLRFPVKSQFISEVSEDDDELIPNKFDLKQNYPNPFNPSTIIEFTLPRREYAEIKIYNALGQSVAALVSDILPPGPHRVTWDGRDYQGRSLPSGIYFYHLVADDREFSRKMVLLK